MTDVTPGCAAGGAAVNGDGRAPARRRSWRVVELLVATLVLFVVAVGSGATAARADWDSGQQQDSNQQQGSDQQQAPSRSQTADEGQFLGLANGQRNSAGSGTLAPDSGLRDIARWWAARMAGQSDIFHNYNLPNEVHDAAAVDGATGLRKFWYVSLPLQLPIATVALLFGIVFTATDMTVTYILTHGGPFNSSHMVTTWAFNVGVESGSLGEGAAVSLYLLPVLALVAVGMLVFARKAEVT